MMALLVIVVGALTVASFAAVGHLARIADAIEAQNRSYGIGAQPAEAQKEAA